MDMSNKTSDENVAKIEEDIKVLNELLENVERTFGGWVDILNEREKKALRNILAEREQKDKRIDLIKEYVHQEIVHYTETIEDYEDDDKKENKHYIEELKEEREHWKDIEKILQNKKKEELYMNWWKYGLYE